MMRPSCLDDGELVYLHLQLLPGAAHQDPFLLQRTDEIQDAADVLNGGGPGPLGAFAHDLGTQPPRLNSSCSMAPSSR